jgi:hypothetical protein
MRRPVFSNSYDLSGKILEDVKNYANQFIKEPTLIRAWIVDGKEINGQKDNG